MSFHCWTFSPTHFKTFLPLFSFVENDNEYGEKVGWIRLGSFLGQMTPDWLWTGCWPIRGLCLETPPRTKAVDTRFNTGIKISDLLPHWPLAGFGSEFMWMSMDIHIHIVLDESFSNFASQDILTNRNTPSPRGKTDRKYEFDSTYANELAYFAESF